MEKEHMNSHQELELPNNVLLIVTGPTASGKDSFISRFRQRHPNFLQIIPYTTRMKRKNEIDGVDYHFLDRENFDRIKDKLVAVTTRVIDNEPVYYGTDKSDITSILTGGSAIWKMDLTTACSLKLTLFEAFPQDVVDLIISRVFITFLGTDRLTVLKDRFVNRDREHDGIKQFLERLKGEWQVWKKYAYLVDYSTINRQGQLDLTINDVEQNLIQFFSKEAPEISILEI